MRLTIRNVEEKELDGSIKLVYEDRIEACKALEKLRNKQVFEGKEGQVFYYTDQDMKYNILIGLGKYDELEKQTLTELVAKGAKEAKKLKLEKFSIAFIETKNMCPGGMTRAFGEGIALSNYTFDKYKTDAKSYDAEVIMTDIPTHRIEKLTKKLEQVNRINEGIITARNLVNEPANALYPESFANQVVEIGQESGFEVEVYDEAWIQEIGMKAFYEVGKGSDHKPRFIVMRYMGAPEREEKIGLVGKGLTFDTGGYSLKPSGSMENMKSDMGGAASVVGTMEALAKNKIKRNVIAVIAACENAISGGSYKPGDIIGSMAGKTIEVLNTDAEGRLTLVDAITYIIDKEKVDKVIDVATLTGAVLVALGTTITGVISNDDAFYAELEEASKHTGEKFWRLPNDESYKKLIKGTFADLKNTGGRHAGTITAGMFIQEFVQDKPWMHLDIAGTSWTDAATPVCPKGGTGAPVKTLYQLIAKKETHHQ